MTIEFVDLKEDITLKQAINHVRKNILDKETIKTCFVIDKNIKLKGTIFLKDLIVSEEDAIIANIMNKNIIYTKTTEDQENIARIRLGIYGSSR